MLGSALFSTFSSGTEKKQKVATDACSWPKPAGVDGGTGGSVVPSSRVAWEDELFRATRAVTHPGATYPRRISKGGKRGSASCTATEQKLALG